MNAARRNRQGYAVVRSSPAINPRGKTDKGVVQIMPENAKPNLFDYATKELSQDAMICWLILWANDRYADIDWELHRCGRRFVLALLDKHGASSLPERITTTIHQQDKSIDVLARVSPPGHVLLIEDKTGTRDHSDQLRRYYKHVIDGRTRLGDVTEKDVYPIYLKTGNQSRATDRRIERATESLPRAYKVFNRSDFLDVLRSYRGAHQALLDFLDYLERRQNSFKGFRDWKRDQQSKWSWESWEGFYQYLDCKLRGANWSYVANRSGGFIGFWWNFIRVSENGGPQIYLQLEADLKNERYLLCFKVCDVPKARRQKLKWKWHKRILEAGSERVIKPRVMRAGKTMTVGHWNGEWLAFSDGKIDLPSTVENLKGAEKILQRAFENGG